MKQICKTIASVALLLSLCFLAGEWPDDTPRRKVITCDSIALAVVAGCGLYLKHSQANGHHEED